MSLPLIIERLSSEPIQVCPIVPNAAAVVLVGNIPGQPGPLAERLQAITYVIDAGGVPIQPGDKGELFIPYNCTIVGWTVLANEPGDITIDIERENLLAFPTVPVESIVGENPPRLLGQRAATGGAAGWNADIQQQSVLRYSVVSAINVQRVLIALTVERV